MDLQNQDSQNTPLKSNSTKVSDSETLSIHLKNETDAIDIKRICISEITFPSIQFPGDIILKSPTPPPKA